MDLLSDNIPDIYNLTNFNSDSKFNLKFTFTNKSLHWKNKKIFTSISYNNQLIDSKLQPDCRHYFDIRKLFKNMNKYKDISDKKYILYVLTNSNRDISINGHIKYILRDKIFVNDFSVKKSYELYFNNNELYKTNEDITFLGDTGKYKKTKSDLYDDNPDESNINEYYLNMYFQEVVNQDINTVIDNALYYCGYDGYDISKGYFQFFSATCYGIYIFFNSTTQLKITKEKIKSINIPIYSQTSQTNMLLCIDIYFNNCKILLFFDKILNLTTSETIKLIPTKLCSLCRLNKNYDLDNIFKKTLICPHQIGMRHTEISDMFNKKIKDITLKIKIEDVLNIVRNIDKNVNYFKQVYKFLKL